MGGHIGKSKWHQRSGAEKHSLGPLLRTIEEHAATGDDSNSDSNNDDGDACASDYAASDSDDNSAARGSDYTDSDSDI